MSLNVWAPWDSFNCSGRPLRKLQSTTRGIFQSVWMTILLSSPAIKSITPRIRFVVSLHLAQRYRQHLDTWSGKRGLDARRTVISRRTSIQCHRGESSGAHELLLGRFNLFNHLHALPPVTMSFEGRLRPLWMSWLNGHFHHDLRRQHHCHLLFISVWFLEKKCVNGADVRFFRCYRHQNLVPKLKPNSPSTFIELW